SAKGRRETNHLIARLWRDPPTQFKEPRRSNPAGFLFFCLPDCLVLLLREAGRLGFFKRRDDRSTLLRPDMALARAGINVDIDLLDAGLELFVAVFASPPVFRSGQQIDVRDKKTTPAG
ncbi:MAG TPA: hypothetical protein VGI89_07250, partial [Rhizomicrobium sp.]